MTAVLRLPTGLLSQRSIIANALRVTPYDIRIEGHTDNVPIHTDQFDSNWELSTARATHMARIFIVGHQFTPARLSASGYAKYHPVTSNATEEGRAQNRRVDIIVLPRMTAPPAPTVHVPATRPAAIPVPAPTEQAAATPLP
jgi:chemotaxis protein MotB